MQRTGRNESIDSTTGKRLHGWWLLLLFQITLVAILGLPATAAGWQLQLLNLSTSALCAFGLSRDQRAFSLNQVFWIFTFVFMGFMPALFYSLNFLPHGLVPVPVLQKASSIVLVCTLLYPLLQLTLNRVYPATSQHQNSKPEITSHGIKLRWLPWLLTLCALVTVVILGPANLWLQTAYWRALESRVPNSVLQLLFQYGLRGAMLYCCLMAVYSYRQGKLSGRKLLVMLILALIANFPLSMSRYLAGTFYLSILLWWLPKKYLKPPSFALILMSVILLAAPLLNATRLQTFTLSEGEKRDFSFLLKTSYTGDYDAYAMLCRTLQYTDSLGNTGGHQLAGVVLFFVPRSMWPNKAVGSGSRVYDVMVPREDHWNNVSCPLLAEGYVNFGIAGSILFTVLLATVLFFYDRHFWQWKKNSGNISFLILFYPVAIGILLLWLRGDLLSAFAYTTGLFVSGWLVHRLLRLLHRGN